MESNAEIPKNRGHRSVSGVRGRETRNKADVGQTYAQPARYDDQFNSFDLPQNSRPGQSRNQYSDQFASYDNAPAYYQRDVRDYRLGPERDLYRNDARY